MTTENLFFHLEIKEKFCGGKKMKRTISLIIAVAVMVAMFIVPVSAADEVYTTATEIASEGDWELAGDITGMLTISSGTYVIDLNGWTWEGQILIHDGDVTIIDSSADKTGLIDATALGDAIDIKAGSLTLDGITVIGAHTSGDAVFVDGGDVTIKNCVLTAGKAGLDTTSSAATVVVENTTFADFEDYAGDQPKDASGRNCAIELRGNAKVTLNGKNKFDVATIICRTNTHTTPIADSFEKGADVTISFAGADAELCVHEGNPYNSNTITYSYAGTTTTPDNGGSTTPDNGGSTTPDNGGSTTPDNNNNADTGDFMSLVIVVAAAALVVTVLSKKRAF